MTVTLNDGNNNIVGTITKANNSDTNEKGYYELIRLKPGYYIVKLDNPNAVDYQLTPQDILFYDSGSSDFHEN